MSEAGAAVPEKATTSYILAHAAQWRPMVVPNAAARRLHAKIADWAPHRGYAGAGFALPGGPIIRLGWFAGRAVVAADGELCRGAGR